MAPVPKDQKAQSHKRMRKSRPQKNPAKQSKFPSDSRRKICLITFPKSCHIQSCPLMSWCFSKRMQDNVLSFRMAKHCPGSFWAAAYRRMMIQAGKQKQRWSHVCPSLVKSTGKAVDNRHPKQKGAPVGKAAKSRRRYSDEEIFYRLATPGLNEAQAGPSGTDPRALDGAGSTPALYQPPAGTLQLAHS